MDIHHEKGTELLHSHGCKFSHHICMNMSVDLFVFTNNERNQGTFTNNYVERLALKQSQIIGFAIGHTPY